jgi:uncharacterized protein (DUF58 family)
MRVWVRNLVLVLLLVLPTIVIGVMSQGIGARVVLGTGVLMLAAGAAIVFMTARQGAAAEREHDERNDLVVSRAMRVTFVLTALAVQEVWALELAGRDTGPQGVNVIYYVFWFSFIGAWAYHNARA